MEQKNEVVKYVQNISLFLIGILFMAFPVIFAINSTNPLILPKQILLGAIVTILLILQIVKMIAEKSVKLRRTPFDIPVMSLAVVALFSCIFAINRSDAFIAFFPFLFAILAYFLIVNVAKDASSLLFLMSSSIIGTILLSVFAILSFFKIYILPFAETHVQTFSPLSSTLEQEIYFLIIFGIAFYYTYRLFRTKVMEGANQAKMTKKEISKIIAFGSGTFIILLGIIVNTYVIFKLDKPAILPIETGFQTAFSEISLDTGRIAQGFLFGSGLGTYSVDFTRWKQASFNQNADLWNLTFFRSSNLVLELLATTGVLGLCAFLFLLIRMFTEVRFSPQNKMLISVIGLMLISFLLPMNFVSQTLLFLVLALFAVNQGLMAKAEDKYFDIELQLVAFKKGIIAMETPHARSAKSLILPSVVGTLLLALIGAFGYYGIPYVMSDLTFQRSLVAASQNNGSLTYQLQTQAINTFPYRDGFYRVFSQTNLALANTLAAQRKQGEQVDQTTQSNITTLIQQAINAARSATAVAPQTNLNWQNLSAIYRSLIGFGQNAESFAIASAQQAIALNPNNPVEYITLGGIYYQLQQWDSAQNQFQLAVTLKPDYANSHYNLGHVLEQKGDYQNALAQYQAVRTLVINDKASFDQIEKEIEVVQSKVQTANQEQTENQQNPLVVDQPQTQLPAQNPPVKIPAPNISTESAR